MRDRLIVPEFDPRIAKASLVDWHFSVPPESQAGKKSNAVRIEIEIKSWFEKPCLAQQFLRLRKKEPAVISSVLPLFLQQKRRKIRSRKWVFLARKPTSGKEVSYFSVLENSISHGHFSPCVITAPKIGSTTSTKILLNRHFVPNACCVWTTQHRGLVIEHFISSFALFGQLFISGFNLVHQLVSCYTF